MRNAGQALAPEYFVVTAPGADFGAESAFAVALVSWIVSENMPETMPDIGTLLSVAPRTYAVAAAHEGAATAGWTNAEWHPSVQERGAR